MERREIWRIILKSVLWPVRSWAGNVKKRWFGHVVFVLALVAVLVTPASAQDHPTQIIFMHHSTGAGLIAGGGVREGFTGLGYEFWDHGYNDDGLTDPAGNALGINWDMPGDNTDPDGWYVIFNQPVTDPPENTFSYMLQADVIIFKSCFPTSNIDSAEKLEEYRQYFLSIRDVIDQHPDKLFIPFTSPPLVPNETTPENAVRAREWANYLSSDEFSAGHPNIAVFDFFNLLADDGGNLRVEYRGDEWDSHPNDLANQTIGPIFVDFVDQAIRSFVPGEAINTPAEPITEETTAEEPGDQPESTVITGADVFSGIETNSEWWTYTNEGVQSFTCEPDADAHDGNQAMRITFDIPAGSTAGCGVNVVSGAAWAEASGIRFYWRADAADHPLRVGLGVRNPEQPDPDQVQATVFDTTLTTPGEDWATVEVRWDQLTKPDWMGDTGVDVFDPAQVVWIVFDVGDWETAQEGSVWIDMVELME